MFKLSYQRNKKEKINAQNTESINNQRGEQKLTQNNKFRNAITFELAETNAGVNNTSTTTSSIYVEISF